METIYIVGENPKNLKDFIETNLIDNSLIKEENCFITNSENFPYPNKVPCYIHNKRFFDNSEKKFYNETVNLYKNYKDSEFTKFCIQNLSNGGFSIARIPVSKKESDSVKNILENLNIPYIPIGNELQKKYNFYSNKIQEIQSKNNGKMPKRETPQGEERHRYIEKMKKLERLAMQRGFKLK